LASPNHDNGINNHDINGFFDEACYLFIDDTVGNHYKINICHIRKNWYYDF